MAARDVIRVTMPNRIGRLHRHQLRLNVPDHERGELRDELIRDVYQLPAVSKFVAVIAG